MKVLIAVEDQRYGEALAEFTGSHKWPPDSEFKILHVVEPILLDHGGDVSFASFLESTAEQATQQAGDLIVKVSSKLQYWLGNGNISKEVVEGHAAAKIIDIAEAWGADMIMVGSHGLHGMSRFLLGSVSAAVVSHAPCSVAVIRLPAESSTTSET